MNDLVKELQKAINETVERKNHYAEKAKDISIPTEASEYCYGRVDEINYTLNYLRKIMKKAQSTK